MIAGLGAKLSGDRELDAAGLVLLPGLVDLHTHLREPGREDTETIATGSAAAALGGFTAVHAMANTDPVADNAEIVEQVVRLGREAGLVDVRPVGAVSRRLAGETLAEIGNMARSSAAVRIFSDDGHCVHDARLMRRALEYVKPFGAAVAQHAQDPRLADHNACAHEGDVSGRLGLPGWPAVAEESIIARDVMLAEHTGSRLHVCHVSHRRLGRGHPLGQVARHRRHGRGDAAPLAAHLRPARVLRPGVQGEPAAASDLRRRGAARRRWPTAPSTPSPPTTPRTRSHDKDHAFGEAAFGMLGLETALGVVAQTMVETGLLDWAGVADRMSVRPARIGRLAKHGRPLAVGEPANLTLVDPSAVMDGRPGATRVPVAQHAVRRTDAARPRGRDVLRRHTDGLGRRTREGWGMTAILVLEDGRTFTGDAYGATGETFGEAVFSTGMTGYQETLTDPCYHRQVVVQTAPHIGNTGVNDEDAESRRIWVAGYVVRDPARRPSNWRSLRSLDDELDAQGIVGISGIDTRALTRHLRERGAMRCGISTDVRSRRDCSRRCSTSPPMTGADLSAEVTTPEPYVVNAIGEERFTVASLDYGIKAMTPHRMAERGITSARAAVDGERRRGARDRRRRGLPRQRPGRPGHGRRRGRDGARTAAPRDPDLRHLLRQPGARTGVRLRHLQARVRAPRHQPAGAGPRAPARSRSPRTTTASPSTRRSTVPPQTDFGARRGQPRVPQRRRRRRPDRPRHAGHSASSTTRKPQPDRTMPPTCSTASWSCWRATNAQAHRHQAHPGDRLRARS